MTAPDLKARADELAQGLTEQIEEWAALDGAGLLYTDVVEVERAKSVAAIAAAIRAGMRGALGEAIQPVLRCALGDEAWAIRGLIATLEEGKP